MERAVMKITRLLSLLVMSLLVIPSVFAGQPVYATTIVRFISEISQLGNPITMPDIVGSTFKVAVVIENVTDLYGFDISTNWTTNYIRYVSHVFTVPASSFPPPNPPSSYEGALNPPIIKVKDEINEGGIPGSYLGAMSWQCAVSMTPALGQNGNATACVFTFRVVDQPYYYAGPVVATNVTLHFVNVDLATHEALPIPYNAEDLNIQLWPRAALYVDVHADKYSYHIGDTMHVELHIINYGHDTHACFALLIETPSGKTKLTLHAHNKLLPAGLDYDNPSFKTFTLPAIAPGIYIWHAVLLDPSTHKTIVEDAAEWQFS